MNSEELKKQLKEIFGEKRTREYKARNIHFDDQEYSVEQLVEKLKNVNELDIAGIHLSALAHDNNELAVKIRQAQAIITQNRIDAFAQAVQYGVADDYLAQFETWIDKLSLKADIEVSDIMKHTDTKGLDTKKLIGIIQKSIDVDVLAEAQAAGFETVDAWKQNNARLLEQQKRRYPGHDKFLG